MWRRQKSMEKQRPQHWFLRLVTGIPLCCLLLTNPAASFTTPISRRQQHVFSVRPSPLPTSSANFQQWRPLLPQTHYYRQNIQRSVLSMSVRTMVRTICFFFRVSHLFHTSRCLFLFGSHFRRTFVSFSYTYIYSHEQTWLSPWINPCCL